MGIRRLISATLIVGLGLIFIKLTQSSNYEVVQAIEKIQETEFADREAVDFILKNFDEGDATASDFIVDYDNLTEFIEIRPSIVEELEALIDQEQKEIDIQNEEKVIIQTKLAKLEADVGPLKYIAEFVYGQEADTNLLEKAVRWVIIIIIFDNICDKCGWH